MCLIIESQDESYLEGQKVLRKGPSDFFFSIGKWRLTHVKELH